MISFIDKHSKWLSAVKQLGRKYAATLGFMPEGGFDDYARAKGIIVDVEQGQLRGYLMYRVVNHSTRIAIAHLVVDEFYRGMGIPKVLLDALRNRFKESSVSGIVLNCREDYVEASRIWQNFGFVAKGRRRSRSVDEHYLTTWWYDYHRKNLFSDVYEETNKVRAMLDMNVIVKLRDAGSVPLEAKEDPSCLAQDWLMEETDFCYAPEVLNEIYRDRDHEREERTKTFLGVLTQAQLHTPEMMSVAEALKSVLPGNTVNTKSDRKEVASCIAAKIPYFITYDQRMLDARNEIEDIYDIQILTPQEFMLEIDEAVHKDEYAPVLLQGVALHTLTRQDSTRLKTKIQTFLNTGKRERKKDFENVVNACLNEKGSVFTISNQDNDLAFYGVCVRGEEEVFSFLRIKDSQLSGSLLYQIIGDAIRDSIHYGQKRVVVKEIFLTEDEKQRLARLGFRECDGRQVKYICSKVIDKVSIPSVLQAMGKDEMHIPKDSIGLVELEKVYFPFKIQDLDIPAYIIPIKAAWAEQLFDYEMASETLFGAKPEKLWNLDNVYYRHTRPITERAPGRILWYVSGKGEKHCSYVVASSYLDEVHTGRAKDLFRLFKYFGIYDWKDIVELCDRKTDEKIRALKFSHTELFRNPVPFEKVQEILQFRGRKKNNFASPVLVTSEVFFDIYQIGTNWDAS